LGNYTVITWLWSLTVNTRAQFKIIFPCDLFDGQVLEQGQPFKTGNR